MSFWDNLFTFTVVVLSFLFRHIFGARHRFVWTPIVFGFYLAGECGLIRLAGNWYLYQLIRLFITFAKAYLLCGFALAPWKRNPAVPLFLLFWGYFQFAVVFGEAPLGAFYFYLKSLEIVAIGYYAGIWAVTTPGGVRRLFLWGAAAAGVVALSWINQGGLLSSSSMDFEQGRAGVSLDKFDADTVKLLFNVNGIALVLSAVIPYAFLFIFEKERLWMRIAAMGVTFVLVILIVRTGARNGALVLLPLGWYLLCAKTTLTVRKKILIVLVLIGGLGAYFVHMQKDVGQLRAFEIFSDKEEGDSLGSGRMGMFCLWTQEMGDRKFFGAGAHYDKYYSQRFRVSNLHSMYMQIWYQSGYVGCALFLVFVFGFTAQALRARNNPYRYAALVLFGAWLLTGVGEAANINSGGGYAKVALGLALALCSRRRIPDADAPCADAPVVPRGGPPLPHAPQHGY